MLSIIIPVYNARKYIYDAVNSALHQPYPDKEILLIDDGSTDDSPEIMNQIANENTNVKVIHQSNAGVSAARNTGIRESKGDYLVFLDADDMLCDNVLNSELMEFIEREIVDMTIFSSVNCNQENTRFGIDAIQPNQILQGRRIYPMYGHFGSAIYRKEYLRQNDILFDEGISLGEDQVFKMKTMYMANHMIGIDQFFYIHRYNLSSLMHSIDRKPDRIFAWQSAYQWISDHLEGIEKEQVLKYVQVKINSRALLYAKQCVQTGLTMEQTKKSLLDLGCWDCIIQSQANEVMPYQIRELESIKNNQGNFLLNAKREGWKTDLGRALMHISVIRHLRDKKKYPAKSISDLI